MKGRQRRALSRERILRAALGLADEGGLASASMRKIAQGLGVEAMSLYHHVANKNDIVDGLLDLVWTEVEPPEAEDWKRALERLARSTRDVLLRHPWAIGSLPADGQPGPAMKRRQDAAVDLLDGAVLPREQAVHAVTLLHAFVVGFVLSEARSPGQPSRDEAFAWGLELVIDGIEVRRFLAVHLQA